MKVFSVVPTRRMKSLSVFIAPFVVLGLALASPIAAHAGSWQLTIDGVGSKTSTSAGLISNNNTGINGKWSDLSSTDTVDPNVKIYPKDSAGYRSTTDTVGPHTHTQGIASVICTWIPSSSTDPVPATLKVTATSEAYADCHYGPGHSPSDFSFYVYNSLNLAVTYQNQPTWPGAGVYWAYAKGSVLQQIQTDGQAVIRFDFATVNLDVQGPGSVSVQPKFSAVVSP